MSDSDNKSEEMTPLERYLAKQKQTKAAKNDIQPPSTRGWAKSAGTSSATPSTAPSVSTPSASVPVVDEKSLEAGLPQPGAAQVEVAPVAGFVPGDMISRIAAFFIDSIVVWALAWPLRAFSSAVFGTFASGIFEFTANALSFLSWYVVVFAYYGWFYSKKGASPGKLLMGLQVIDSTDGGHLTYWRAFFREAIGKWISMVPLGIGYFTAFFRSDRRALHDLLFDTAVVKGPSAKNKT